MAEKDQIPACGAAAADVDAFLRQAALTPSTGSGARRGRLMFAMDATASREPTWAQACRIQADLFAVTASLGRLAVQLVYYRGFGECRASRWVADAPTLGDLMAAVRCRAGKTQIGRVLAHCAKEARRDRIDALVFVGDCMEEDIDHLAHLAGELGLLGVPVFIFHEGRDAMAASAFAAIARLTGGACCPFDASSARQLRELLGAVAVYATGGHAALEDFSRTGSAAVRQLTSQLGRRPAAGG